MRIVDHWRLRKQRRQALEQIADYYIDQAQRLAQPANYVPYSPGARVAPGDPVYSSATVDPYSQTPPNPMTNVHAEPDPELTRSVAQLADELNTKTMVADASRDAKLNVIRRRVG